jgi:hypothetical protein
MTGRVQQREPVGSAMLDPDTFNKNFRWFDQLFQAYVAVFVRYLESLLEDS